MAGQKSDTREQSSQELLEQKRQEVTLLSVRTTDITRFKVKSAPNITTLVYVRHRSSSDAKSCRCWITGDPFVGQIHDCWKLIGRTELVRGRHNATFADTFRLEYEEQTRDEISIRIEVYNVVRAFRFGKIRRLSHVDSKMNLSLRRSEFVGACEVDLKHLLRASDRGGEARVALHNVLHPHNRDRDGLCKNGYAILTVDPVTKRDPRLFEIDVGIEQMRLRKAQQAMKVRRFNPFLQIYRKRSDAPNSWVLIHRSEALRSVKNRKNFKMIVLPAEVLVPSEAQQVFRIEICHSPGKDKSYRLLGWIDLTPEELMCTMIGEHVGTLYGPADNARKYNLDGKVTAESCVCLKEKAWLTPLRFTIACAPSYRMMPMRISWRQAKEFKLDPTKDAKSWEIDAHPLDAHERAS